MAFKTTLDGERAIREHARRDARTPSAFLHFFLERTLLADERKGTERSNG